MLTAIVGVNWGDEGKGRMVDLLSAGADIVARYQGGNNAGHTVKNERGKFVLNLLPSGILRPEVVCVMGNGMLIDPAHLDKEIAALREKGVKITPENLKISDRATICMPYHRELDGLEEDRLAEHKFGSTRRGIAPVYADKYMKKALRMGDLLHAEGLRGRLREIVEWKNLTMSSYGRTVDADEMYDWLMANGEGLLSYIKDASAYLGRAIDSGLNVMFEAQLGALRDIDYGIYPYTSSSNTLASYAPIGAGVPGRRLDRVIGIMKAYSSCVGEGPFTCEFHGAEAERLREAGGEYGAKTGRPRRVGPIDLVATRYGVQVQGATEIALTKLDVLSYMKEIPVCAHYQLGGEQTDEFPIPAVLAQAKPVTEVLPGWGCDISGVRRWEDLPQAARDYVEYVEREIGCRITYVSVGPERDSIIIR